MKMLRAVEFVENNLCFINQAKLPLEEEIIISDKYERISEAIERLEIRGAPAIGIAAAYALALSLKDIPVENYLKTFDNAYQRLTLTRPTAVNLFYCLGEMKKVFDEFHKDENIYSRLVKKAKEIHNYDINLCNAIADNGSAIFKKKSRVLTHCNTGFLATGGDGTALNVIRKAFEIGLVEHVYVDETRPLLQGSRLTAWELENLGIPFSINTDSTAAVLMQKGKLDLVITGADRIAVNGDTANKIGTYNLAVLCSFHNIPFYIAAPGTTIDKNCPNGEKINIELRSGKELTQFCGKQITRDYPAYCPAFDVTSYELITAIITEQGIHKPPFDFKNV
jgi:methylthioribose-1-phosphate isomerase